MTETTSTRKSPPAKVLPLEEWEERQEIFWARDERHSELSPSAEIGRLNGRPISHRRLDTFERPSPALTPAQRLHLDVYGYVVVENVLTAAEVEELRSDIAGIEQRFRAGESLDELRPMWHANQHRAQPEYFRIENLAHVGPSFFDYVTHPRIVGMAEEAIGGPARPQQSTVHVHRPGADKGEQQYGFHRASPRMAGKVGLAGTIANGLYHHYFVKALTNLTDLGPDDGGTAVIAGTHKISGEVELQALIDAAMADPSLIHHVVAPPGSTLLFFESLVHSVGINRSGRERVVIIGGYTPHLFAADAGYQPATELIRHLPEDYRKFFTGWYGHVWPGIDPRSLSDSPPSSW